ncbi:MAG: hypothetical protein ACPGU7_13270 [Gammaproteobacteria bacterium]
MRNYANALGDRIGFPVTLEKRGENYSLTVRNDVWSMRIEASGLDALDNVMERFLNGS